MPHFSVIQSPRFVGLSPVESNANSLISALVPPSENHTEAVPSFPLSAKVQPSLVILFWNAEYVGAFSLPTIASATPWSCLYSMPVAFLNRNAAAKHAFEKTRGIEASRRVLLI